MQGTYQLLSVTEKIYVVFRADICMIIESYLYLFANK